MFIVSAFSVQKRFSKVFKFELLQLTLMIHQKDFRTMTKRVSQKISLAHLTVPIKISVSVNINIKCLLVVRVGSLNY